MKANSPFFPFTNNWKGRKIQLPVTLPCLHEAKQFLRTNSGETVINYMLSHINDSYNVLCVHAYYEGILERRIFAALLDELKARDFEIVPLKTLHETLEISAIPYHEIAKKKLPGGRGEISCQGKRV